VNEIPNNVFMLDIETRGTKPGCAIGSIGCVRLSDNAAFYTRMYWEKQPDYTEDEATIAWWNTQPPELYEEAMKGTDDSETQLRELAKFLMSGDKLPIMWCKGTDFDIPILADLYKRYGMATPWKYNDVRDFRTVKKVFAWPSAPRSATEMHNAIWDAVHQGEELLRMVATHSIQLD